MSVAMLDAALRVCAQELERYSSLGPGLVTRDAARISLVGAPGA
jgi:hypothetical protein